EGSSSSKAKSAEIDRLKNEVASLHSQVQGKVAQRDEAFNERTDEIDTLKEKIISLEASLEKRTNESDEKAAEIKILNERAASLQAELQEREHEARQLVDARELLDDTKSRCDGLRNLIVDLEAKLKSEEEGASKVKLALEAKITALQDELDRVNRLRMNSSHGPRVGDEVTVVDEREYEASAKPSLTRQPTRIMNQVAQENEARGVDLHPVEDSSKARSGAWTDTMSTLKINDKKREKNPSAPSNQEVLDFPSAAPQKKVSRTSGDATEAFPSSQSPTIVYPSQASTFSDNRQSHQSKNLTAESKFDEDTPTRILITVKGTYKDECCVRFLLCNPSRPAKNPLVLFQEKLGHRKTLRILLTEEESDAWLSCKKQLRVETNHEPRQWVVCPVPR
ncbi:hypothetical protein FOZ62_030584, partial [Perkinsus olseni]